MKTSAEYLDAIKAKQSLSSDYAVSKALGISRQRITAYRKGDDSFSDETAAKVAELLDADPEEVVIAAHAERAKDERTRALWARLAKKAGYAAGVALFAAASLQSAGPSVGIMSTSTRRRPGFRDDDETPQQSTEQARNRGFFFAH